MHGTRGNSSRRLRLTRCAAAVNPPRETALATAASRRGHVLTLPAKADGAQ
jgi:hypothetical protein